jgi:hypothetical protein
MRFVNNPLLQDKGVAIGGNFLVDFGLRGDFLGIEANTLCM